MLPEKWLIKPCFGMALNTKIQWGISGLLYLLFHLNTASAQLRPEEELAQYTELYPSESVVMLHKNETVDYTFRNDSLIAIITVYEETLYLSDNSAWYTSDQVYSSTFSEVQDLQAYTLIPDKRKYNQVNVSEFKESFDKSSFIFFDDTKLITFTYPGVQKGAKTVLTYKKIIRQPRMVPVFFFQYTLPVHEAQYTVIHDPEVHIQPYTFNDPGGMITSQEQIRAGKISLVTKSQHIPKVDIEHDSPSYHYLSAASYSPVTTYTHLGTEYHLLDSPSSLHHWYRSFLKNALEPSEELHQLALSLIDADDSDFEKVRKIYKWVQTNIKYIAFEDGMRGLVPHPALYVAEKRYGDCKDMASTIVGLLREVGIEADYTWIGTRDIPYAYSEVPSPVVDNHMIATYQHEGKTFFLDATNNYLPVSLPSSMIQGKECLISLGADDFRIVQVPVIPREENVMADSVTIRLQNGSVKGSGATTLTGYAKVFNRYKMTRSSQKEVDDYLKRLLSKGSNKFQLDHYDLMDMESAHPLEVDYTFNIESYAKSVGNQIYVNLMLDKTYTDGLIENRTSPVENDYKYINKSTVRLELPEGYEASEIPQNEANHNSVFGYSISYEVRDQSIIARKEFYLDYLLMEPEHFGDWNTIINEYAKACRKAVVLNKISK